MKWRRLRFRKSFARNESRLPKIYHGPLFNAAFPALIPNLNFILSFYPVYLFLWILVWRFLNRTPKNENAGFSVPNVIFEKVLIYPNDLLFNLLLAIIWIRKDITWTRTRRVLGPLRPTRRFLGNGKNLSLSGKNKPIWGIVKKEMVGAAIARKTVISR